MLLTACLVAAPLVAPAPSACPDDPDGLVALAEALAAHDAARLAGADPAPSRTALETALGGLSEELGGAHPLGDAAFLSRAAWLARGYDDRGADDAVVVRTFPAPGLTGGELELAWRLPEDYDADRAWPLVLAIPDEGERVQDHLREHWAAEALREGWIVAVPAMPADVEAWDRIALQGRAGGISHALTALRLCDERLAVDFDRVAVVGRGTGVATALAVGNHAPHRFAGVAGRAGDAGDPRDEGGATALGAGNFRSLPVWLAGAGANATALQEAARAEGIGHVTLAPTGGEAELVAWLAERRREPFPTTAQLVVGKPFPTRAHWLRLAPMAPDARAVATADRATNTIALEVRGASSATLYLNDRLVDLDRPLTVTWDDQTRVVDLVPRLDDALALLADGTSDPGAVYTVELVVDLAGWAPAPPERAPDPEFDALLAAAEGDPDALWELYGWCTFSDRDHETERVLRRILRLAPDHARARDAMGHHRHETDGGPRWFDSEARLDRWLERRDEATAKERGLVRVRLDSGEAWVHPDERAAAKRAKDKDPNTGQWLASGDLARLREGWGRQDTVWIAPDEAHLADDGLVRIGHEWVDARRADQHHAHLARMWTIPDDRVLLRTTLPRATALAAIEHMGAALPHLRAVFGAEPALPLSVAMVRDQEQYDRFAFGAPDGRRAARHAGRTNMVHSAFLAESWFERVDGEAVHRGTGVGYWDVTVPHGDAYGRHAARLAVGLAWVEALDPSPDAVRDAEGDGPGEGFHAAWRAEKRLPDWLRWGGPVFAERWFLDPDAEDPAWARAWSKENLAARGGLRPLAEVLTAELRPEDRDHSMRLLLEWGAVVAFVVDGGDPAVAEAHADLKRALATRRSPKKALAALVEVLLEREGAVRAFTR